MQERHNTSKGYTIPCSTRQSVQGLRTVLLTGLVILMVHGPRARGALGDTVITPFRGGAAGAYTFTFDDGAAGQWQHAVPILNEHCIHGTFFLVGETVKEYYGTTARIHVPQMLSIAAAGHEIGSHTYHHYVPPYAGPLTCMTDAEVHAEMAMNQEYFAKWGITAASMAYPAAATDARVQLIVGQYAEFARAGYPRTTNSSTWKDLNPLDLRWSSLSTDHFECVGQAINTNTWAIGVFHEIGYGGGPSVETFDAFVSQVVDRRDAGTLWVDTIRDVGGYLRERSDAIVTKRYDAGTQTILVLLTMPEKYPHTIVPLTLRTRIDGYVVKTVNQAEWPLTFDVINDGTGTVVQYDAVPDGGGVEIALTSPPKGP